MNGRTRSSGSGTPERSRSPRVVPSVAAPWLGSGSDGSRRFVPDAELPLDLFQIVDVHPRGERFAAPGAQRRFALRADLAVEGDAELRGTLKNVKELAKRQ